MEFLLVAQQEVSPSEASFALRALERFLLSVRPLMAFQMLQSSERALTGRADMRPRFVCLWWGEIGNRSFSIHSNCRAGLIVGESIPNDG